MSGRLVNPWTPGTTYPPGSVIRPTTVTGNSANPPTNGDFEAGNLSGWTPDAGWVISASGQYAGSYCAKLPAGAGSNKKLVNNLKASISLTLGQNITARAFVNVGSVAGGATVAITLTFYNGAGTALATYTAPAVDAFSGGGWVQTQITAGQFAAASVSVGFIATNTSGFDLLVDGVTWDYLTDPYNAPLVFYAKQPGTGKSGDVEPNWPTTTGTGDIPDGTVIWTAKAPTSITWYTTPLLKSGSIEPGQPSGPPPWPTVPGQSVHDTLSTPPSGMDWLCVTPQVIDQPDKTKPPLPPQSKYVFIAASKIFCLDGDIARYSATTNCLDWTSEGNAGFLPIGLRAFGTNPFMAAGVYRSNGVFLNSEGQQMWQLDEDPANMAMLDAIPVGCTRHRSIASVNDDMLFLSSQGVRSMGISAGSGNLQAGDVGMPIDPLVRDAMTWADANGVDPIGGYFPSLGQYFLAFPNWPGPNPQGPNPIWSYAGAGVCSGTNAYTVSIPGVTSYVPGVYYLLTFTNNNPGGCSLNINGIGNRNLGGLFDIVPGSTWMVTYDVAFGGFFITDVTRVFVYTMGRTGEVGSWSHYCFQYLIEHFVQAGDNLYMRGVRDGQPQVFMFDRNAIYDSIAFAPWTAATNKESWGVVQWPWLDDGQPGLTKQMSGFDLAVTTTASFSVEVGYDQINKGVMTTPHFLFGDTTTGMMVPLQVKAPSFSMRLVFDAAGNWSVQATDLYLTDKRIGS